MRSVVTIMRLLKSSFLAFSNIGDINFAHTGKQYKLASHHPPHEGSAIRV